MLNHRSYRSRTSQWLKVAQCQFKEIKSKSKENNTFARCCICSLFLTCRALYLFLVQHAVLLSGAHTATGVPAVKGCAVVQGAVLDVALVQWMVVGRTLVGRTVKGRAVKGRAVEGRAVDGRAVKDGAIEGGTVI